MRKRSAKRSGSVSSRLRVQSAVKQPAHGAHRGLPPPVPPRRKLAETLVGSITPSDFSDSPPTGDLRLALGRSGDHASVYHMLLAVFQGPSRDEFHAQTEDPFYEPSDRLLVKRGYRVLSHLHLIRRTMQFGQTAVPVTGVHWLGTLPEFRGEGLASRLVREAERRMADEGTLVGLVRTPSPRFFQRVGWSLCGRHCFSQAKSREVLARLHGEHAARLAKPLSIRLWRHVEMPALIRIYQQNTQHAYGPLERTEAYWRWLVGRKAYDSLLVALDGPDKLELEETIAPIVGYAVLRQGRVIELMTTPGHATAHHQLLARACGDAIEHDRQDFALHAPPVHPLHRLVCASGGLLHNQEIEQGDVFMVKILDPPKFLAHLSPELDARARQANLPRETELGLSVDGVKWRLVYTRRGFRVRPGKLGRSYLVLNRAEFTRLALGHGSVRETAFAERLQASTQTALELANILFPQLPLWRPPWDDLPV
jgi:predicted acetyltransferase